MKYKKTKELDKKLEELRQLQDAGLPGDQEDFNAKVVDFLYDTIGRLLIDIDGELIPRIRASKPYF